MTRSNHLHTDLGVIDGPILVFGGPYSNLAATLAMREVAEERLGLLPGRIICTGDIVAYCAEPQPTVDTIREWGIHVIQGNCEESLAGGANDCGCGFEKGSACEVLSAQWYPFATRHISKETRTWMGTLPDTIGFEFLGRTFLVVHGGVDQKNRFLFPSTDPSIILAEMKRAGTDGVIAGHAGLPFGRTMANRLWLNAGVIGMPANDGTQDGWYMVLEPRGKRIQISWRRLHYAAERAYQAMLKAGLDNGYAQALLSGRWPSMAVLSENERQQQGRSLCPQPLWYS